MAVVPCPAPGDASDNIGGATSDMGGTSFADHLSAPGLDDDPAHGLGCLCGGSGLLGGGPQPGSLEASGSPPDLVAPVG